MPKISKRVQLVLLVIIVLIGIIAFVVYQESKRPLHPISNLSTLQTAAEAEAYLNERLPTGSLTRDQVQSFLRREGIESCSNLTERIICFTHAPSEAIGQNIIDSFFYAVVFKWYYAVEVTFTDNLFDGLSVDKGFVGF